MRHPSPPPCITLDEDDLPPPLHPPPF